MILDTKKKELIGDFRNRGREWRPHGQPEEVRTHDFMDHDLGKVNPYGVYDQSANVGWVSVGTDHDTAEFAVESIRRWWLKLHRAPEGKERVIRHGVIGGIEYLVSSNPLVSKRGCLKCHGRPDKAPEIIRTTYGTEAGYKLSPRRSSRSWCRRSSHGLYLGCYP